LCVLDLIAKLDDDTICNIEMQMSAKEAIIERILFYWSRCYSGQLKKGESYDKLKKTIVILISNESLPDLGHLSYVSSWQIIETKKRQTILTDLLEIYIIELPKIEEAENDNELLDWLLFLEDPKSDRVVEKMKENEELSIAKKKLETLSQDEKMQKLAELRERAILDKNTAVSVSYENGKKEGIKQGEKQGIKKGMEQGAIEIAKNLIKQGVSMSIIVQATNLSKEYIERLKQELEQK